MPLMTWDPQFTVQVKQFDNDHKHLFNMVNDLNEAMRAGKGKTSFRRFWLGSPPMLNAISPRKRRRCAARNIQM